MKTIFLVFIIISIVKKGYGGIISNEIENCKEFLGNNHEKCEVCNNGYFLYPPGTNYFCKKCPVLCTSCVSEQKCTKCKSRYFIDEGKCKKCGTGCLECNNIGCKKCDAIFDLKDGSCEYKIYFGGSIMIAISILTLLLCLTNFSIIKEYFSKDNLNQGNVSIIGSSGLLSAEGFDESNKE